MASRKTLFAISFFSALLVYAGLFAAAPGIKVIRANSRAREVLTLFKVDLRPAPPRRDTAAGTSETLASRPGSVRDLLEREEHAIVALERLEHEPAEVPALSERAAAEAIERSHYLEADRGALKKVDARILEIAQDMARRNIEVVRRLVRPSPVRVVKKGEYPTLRGRAGAGEEVMRIAPRPSTLADEGSAAEGAGTPRDEPKPGKPAFEEGVLSPEIVEPGLPELPIETVVALAPAQEAIRRESPYAFLDDLVDIQLEAYVPQDEPLGFFRVRIVPKRGEPVDALPKDVTFVVDASKSILQRKLDLTVRGLRDCIALLRPEDRFNIVVFRDTPTLFRGELTEASKETKTAAYAFLEGLEARGETDIYNAIRPVIQNPPPPGRPGIVVVMTDGRPTKGVLSGREIINALTADNVHRNTVYAFGGGRTVNRSLLDLLAYRNKGESRVAARMDDIDEELPRFFSRLHEPMLVRLSADYGRIDEDEIFPKELPDFYRGRAVTVFGRFDPRTDKDFVMRLEGTAGRGEKELVFKADLAGAVSGDPDIARQWAFQKIYYLIGEMVRVGEEPELLQELRRLGRKYDIRTSYTQ